MRKKILMGIIILALVMVNVLAISPVGNCQEEKDIPRIRNVELHCEG